LPVATDEVVGFAREAQADPRPTQRSGIARIPPRPPDQRLPPHLGIRFRRAPASIPPSRRN